MKRVTQILAIMLLLVVPAIPVHSATSDVSNTAVTLDENTCAAVVQQAWDNVDQLCFGAGRNKACYGHQLLDAQPQPSVSSFVFDEEGHTVNIVDLRSLRLSTMDLISGHWGVALMQIQANLPSTMPDKNVSLLLFGDVGIDNASPHITPLDVTVKSNSIWPNVRYRPSTQAPVLGSLAPDAVVQATGRLEDGSWLRIEMPDLSVSGWISAPLLQAVDAGADFETLAVVDPDSTYFGPMQAFYFSSGMNDAACPEAPNSGILIQTPEGVAEVTLLINEVDIRLGSTVYFQAEPGNEMLVSVVEGHARVTANGVTHTAVAGTQISIPMDENMQASGEPSLPRPYDMSQLQGLPVAHMARTVEIAEPLTEEQVAEVITAQQDDTVATVPGEGEGLVDMDGDGTPDTPPGLVDNPGLGDSLPPGQGGDTPPGQDKDKDKPPKDDKDKDK